MAASRKLQQTVTIPKYTQESTTDAPKTPKTPADEGIDFFESTYKPGDEPIRVYEIQLDPDGGPNKDRSVASFFRLHPRAHCLWRVEHVY